MTADTPREASVTDLYASPALADVIGCEGEGTDKLVSPTGARACTDSTARTMPIANGESIEALPLSNPILETLSSVGMITLADLTSFDPTTCSISMDSAVLGAYFSSAFLMPKASTGSHPHRSCVQI